MRGAGSVGFTTVFYYDGLQRPIAFYNDLPTPGNDVNVGLGYNPASQIVSRSVDNDAYAAPPAYNVARGYQVNGLNQYTGTTHGGAPNWSFEYDSNGNLKRAIDPVGTGTTNYLYDVENRLVSASGAANATLVYDPLGRLVQVTNAGGATTQFLYDGDRMIAEYDGLGTLLKRYVHGAGADEPVAAYDGAGLGIATRRYMLPDERGSVTALINADGSPATVNRYDAWGVPGAGNAGRFQYTGQAWIGELGLYHYKARFYSPTLGRFMQTDPIGYEGGVNLYAYVGNDPVNLVDPAGTDPGDPYSSTTDASVDFENFYNPASKELNVEFHGAIYELDGSYYASHGTISTIKGGTVKVSIPLRAVFLEDIHTHGDYSKKAPGSGVKYIRTTRGGDLFDSDNVNRDDRARADLSGRPVTVGTPSGIYKRYDPRTGKTRKIRPYEPKVKPGAPRRRHPAPPNVGSSCDRKRAGSCGTGLETWE